MSSWAIWISLALIILNISVFESVRNNEFVGLDDTVYVSQNPHVNGGLSWRNVYWAWTTGYGANWHPLTWLSHMLDVQLFGLDAGAHHVISLILHIASTLLLFGFLRRLTGATGRSAFVAALFAVHPLHVESVSWIAERKDVLSTLFWLLALWAYAAYARQPGSKLRWRSYLLALLFLVLGLLTKPMLVTLPFVLLLLDAWPLKRTSISGATDLRSQVSGWLPLVVEKLPFFTLAAISCVVTYVVQQHAGAVARIDVLPLGTRLANTAVAYVAYICKMLWPAHLAVFYPFPRFVHVSWVSAALLALICTSVVVLRARRYPYLLVGWFWYVGTLVPVIGLIQVGMQAMADRYTYVPLIGIFIIIAWGVPDLLARWPARRWMLPAAALAVTLACAVTARSQVQSWTNNMTLWSHALEVTRDNYRAHAEVGAMLANQGKQEEAFPHFQECVRLEPSFPEARYNLGLALASQGRVNEAIEQYAEAVRLNPDFWDAHLQLGSALLSVKKIDDALAHYSEAVRLKPDLAEARNGLGLALVAAGKYSEAGLQFGEAVRLQPDDALSRIYLGGALASAGRFDAAVQQFREALRINPKDERALSALDMLAKRGKYTALPGRR